jgi:hypothetical protein
VDRRYVLDDRKTESSAPIGAASGVVDTVEALEDPLELGRWNADSIVRDCDLDIVIVTSGLHVRRDDDARSGVGIDHGVLNQVSDRHTELASAAQHAGPCDPCHGQRDPLPFRVHTSSLDGVGQHLINVNDLRMNQRVVGLESRELDDLANEIAQPRRLDTHAAGEFADRVRVLGSILHRFGQ